MLHFPENALKVQHKRNGKRGHFQILLHLCYDSERADFEFLHFVPKNCAKPLDDEMLL